jgi:phosphonate ABC transporter permease subunit PhnE
MKQEKSSLWKSAQRGLGFALVIVIFAYGFEVTKINLEELESERRQGSLTRVLRTLARPDILEYDQEEVIVNAPIYVPCPADGSVPEIPEPDTSQAHLIITPACAAPGETVTVVGYGFSPYSQGPLRFVPGHDPTNVVTLGRDVLETDASGHFTLEFKLPERESEEFQYIRATARQNIGAPRFSRTAYETWDKIVETVFMALLATAAGTLLAIPISFVAARNLMKPVRSPLASIALSALGWPLGVLLGLQLVRWVGGLSAPYASSLPIVAASVIGVPLVTSFALRWALPQVELKPPTQALRLSRAGVVFAAMLMLFFGLFQLASLMTLVGEIFSASLGRFGFFGTLLYQSGAILHLIIPLLAALAAGGAVSGYLGRIGQRLSETLGVQGVRALNLVLAPAMGATYMVLGGALLDWFYQWGRPELTVYRPAAAGAALGFVAAILIRPKASLSIGLFVYYVTRTILNALRSIEALVMAIVFVIAVGIGPFAGALALGLHTIVSLAKLYSEQVESIMAGPLEAVQATGANRLQTIVYAVVPQIIPPYISYTMYRWDINVRMSTIIGFVGGGGIGFLLQQNINLLNYRAASTQMLAIAVVVALMDYVSSVLRERYV